LHQPFQKGERSMTKIRNVTTLQRFASDHASNHSHSKLERQLTRRHDFKQKCVATLPEWYLPVA
jgi:putative transposase